MFRSLASVAFLTSIIVSLAGCAKTIDRSARIEDAKHDSYAGALNEIVEDESKAK